MIPKFRAWDKETKTMNGMAEIYRNRNQKMMKKREMPKIDDFVFALQVGKLVVDTAKAIIVDDNILGSNGKFVLDGHTFNITVSEVE